MTSPESPSSARPASPAARRGLVLFAVLPFLLLALWNLRAPIDLSIGDQAQYLLHARAMLEGRSYTDNGYIYYPRVAISPEAYPPGTPLMVAITEGLGGGLLATRLSMIAAAVLFFWIAAHYLASRDDPLLGPAAILVSGLVPGIALYASAVGSDFAFCAAAWGCCLLVDRPGRWTPGRIAALSLVGAVAILFRTVGVALIPALVVYQTWRTWKHGEPWARAVAPIIAWIATFLLIDFLLPVSSSYAQQITSAGADSASKPGWTVLVTLLAQRVLDYRDFVSGLQFTPTGLRGVNMAYHVAALAAMGVGAVAWVRRAGVRFLFCLVVFYVAAFLPMPWSIGRFLWPLLPIIWFATLDGVRLALQAARVERARAERASIAAALSVALVTTLFGRAEEFVGMGDVPQGRALYQVLEREAAAAPMRVLFFNPRDAARIPGVSAMSVPRLPPDSLLAEADARRITHAIAGSLGSDRRGGRRLREALRARPERFERLYGNGVFTLYRILPPRARVATSPDTVPKP